MKIISPFKDYYDNVSHQYRDDELLFIRKPNTKPFKKDIRVPSYARDLKGKPHDARLEFQVIGFCGHLYPVLAVSHAYSWGYSATGFEKFHLYSLDEYDEAIKRFNFQVAKDSTWRWRTYDFDTSKKDVKEFFELKDKDLLDVFEQEQTPIFIYTHENREPVIKTNHFLKPFDFVKIKDPYTAHQELAMYVGGVLRQPERPMVQITDADKIHKHGFDKWSFRKLPTKRKE